MKKLKWGETPWDNWSREDLLREVQKMASALQSAESVLGMMSLDREIIHTGASAVPGATRRRRCDRLY